MISENCMIVLTNLPFHCKISSTIHITYFDVTHIFCHLQTTVWSVWLFGMFYAAKASALEFQMYFVTRKESRLVWQLSWRRILGLYREWKSSKYWDYVVSRTENEEKYFLKHYESYIFRLAHIWSSRSVQLIFYM